MSRFRGKLTEYPELMRQWDYDKNDLDPTQMTVGSGAIVWWKCEKGHSWQAEIKGRRRGTGCPYCAGKKVFTGVNDLKTCKPELAKEWDYEKNELTALQVTSGSKKMAWWKCEKGHSWQAIVYSRSKGHGCPVCDNKIILIGFNDLPTLRPDIAQDWDYDKNKEVPSQFATGSSKSVWWICKKGHSWKTTIANRTNKKTGTNCPYCAGKIVVSGANDLQTLNPVLAQEWDYGKNELLPSQVMPMSNKSVWWICSKGHSFQSPVYSRTQGSGCSYCSGKRVLARFNDLQTVNPELASQWDYEKNVLTPAQVTSCSGKTAWWKCGNGHSWEYRISYRNYGSGCPYCTKKKAVRRFPKNPKPLKQKLLDEWDYSRNEILPSQVFSQSLESVWWVCKKGHSWQTQVKYRSNGGKCPHCARVRVFEGINDLQTINPKLAEEWDKDKNILMPNQVMATADKKVWWICFRGHSWQERIRQRHLNRYGCPYCSGQRVLKGFNDLQTRYPALAREWDYDRNELLPTQITAGSNKKMWWHCGKGHSWKAQIRSRKNGKGCPYCAGRYVLAGFNDLQTLRPDLVLEWDYDKNMLKPSQFTVSSGKSVWWKCSKGHSWKTNIQNRSGAGCDCPYCFGRIQYIPRCVK